MKRTLTLFLTMFIGASMLLGQTPPALEKLSVDTVDYWIIWTPTDLIWLADPDTTLLDADSDGTDDFESLAAKLGANYRLGTDIIFEEDPAFVDWNNDGTVGVGADTLGLYAIGGDGAPRFTGHFDGRNYAIENVYKSNTASLWQRIALFGSVEGCTIENLYVKNVHFRNNEDYGGIICARATYGGPNVFRRIYVDGVYDHRFKISGSLHCAGIVGRADNTEISECVSMMTGIAVRGRFGGIIGTAGNSVVIKNSYSVSTFTGREKMGLVVGISEGDSTTVIENCYAAGSIIGTVDAGSDIGVFAGSLINGIVPVSCYWDTEVDTTAGVGAGDSLAIVAVKGLTTVEFSSMTSFEGWDFDNTWAMGTVDGTNRPYLQWLDEGPIVGIPEKENAKSSMIKVYPNPATSVLTIDNAPVNAEYRMMNIIGQVVESGIISGNKVMLNLDNYRKGIYLLVIGEEVSKIMVE